MQFDYFCVEHISNPGWTVTASNFCVERNVCDKDGPSARD